MAKNPGNATENKERQYAKSLRRKPLKNAPRFDLTITLSKNKIDSREKEQTAAAELNQRKKFSNIPQDNTDSDNLNYFKHPEENDQEGNDREKKEREWMRRMNTAKRLAKANDLGPKFYGRGNGDFGDNEKAGKNGIEDGFDAARTGSNLPDSKTNKIARQKVSTELGKAAVLSTLQKGIKKIAGNALLDWAFGALFTVVGSVPALLYLDFHYVMSKFGSKIFSKMALWQEIILLIANFLAILIILIIILIIVVISNPLSLLGQPL